MSHNELNSQSAGRRVIHGSAVRTVGYGASFLFGIVASSLLLRHLGVTDFGRYVTVLSLIGIVSGVTDAGLTSVGARELSVCENPVERERLLRSLIGMRLLLTPCGVMLALLFTVVAGYDGQMIAGTALAGIGLVLVNAQATMMLPLSVQLLNTQITVVEVLRQAVMAVAIALLVVMGATFVPLFAAQVVVGFVAVAVTPVFWRYGVVMRPNFHLKTAKRLVAEALPVAIALAMNVIYLRVLVIFMSLLAEPVQTGLFGASFRVFEALLGIPALAMGVSLPLLSVAAQANRERLAYVLHRMAEVGLVLGLGIVLALVAWAEPAIRILGGSEYSGAAPILRIQSVALLFVFFGQVWQLGLLAIRQQRSLVTANATALVVVILLGVVGIKLQAAVGAAVAAVVAEAVLAGCLLVLIERADPRLAPRLGFSIKVLLCAAPAALLLVLPLSVGLPVRGVFAVVLYAALILVTRSLPSEVFAAFKFRSR